MPEQDDPINRFLSQPPEEGVGDHEEAERPRSAPHCGFWGSLNHFLFEKKRSDYSSISPRRADGTRTKPFFFNGNGRGR